MGVVVRKAPEIDNRIERQITLGMIVSDRFCQAIKPLWREDSFQSRYGKLVGQWCLKYFEEYQKAPGRHIEDLFLNNSCNIPADDAESVKLFLSSISEEFAAEGTFNVDYIVDQAEKHFRLTSLSSLKERLSMALVSGQPEDAESLIEEYVRPSRPKNKGGNPIKDLNNILMAFQAEEFSRLIRLPGVMGDIIGSINRGELVAVVGPSGVGKTWWLLFIAYLASLRGYNVTFFSYEMPQHQITRRVQQMITGRPKAGRGGQVLIPVWDCYLNQHGLCSDSRRTGRTQLCSGGAPPSFAAAPRDYIPCAECKGSAAWYPDSWFKEDQREEISTDVIVNKHRSIMSAGAGRIGDFHVAAFPSGQHSINDVRAYLKNREYYEGVVTDLVITDSADKMKPEGRHGDERHGIYSIWMGHKALAAEFHAGVLTVSHSNTERTGKRVKQGDWAEDIRKLRESDSAWAVNQSPADKAAGRYSIGMLKLRDDDFDLYNSTMVLSCLKIGRPYLDSALERRYTPKEKEETPKVLTKKTR